MIGEVPESAKNAVREISFPELPNFNGSERAEEHKQTNEMKHCVKNRDLIAENH